MRLHVTLLLCLAFISDPPTAQERIIRGDGIVAVNVNGAPGRLRVDPAAPALPILTLDYAVRARLRAGDHRPGGG